jgi:hypothetical protein
MDYPNFELENKQINLQIAANFTRQRLLSQPHVMNEKSSTFYIVISMVKMKQNFFSAYIISDYIP